MHMGLPMRICQIEFIHCKGGGLWNGVLEQLLCIHTDFCPASEQDLPKIPASQETFSHVDQLDHLILHHFVINSHSSLLNWSQSIPLLYMLLLYGHRSD